MQRAQRYLVPFGPKQTPHFFTDILVIGAGIVWGLSIAAFGLVRSLPLGLFFLALAGMGDMISEILRNALLQRYTPDQLRGRVSSLYLAQVTGAPAIGNVEAGAVARLVSPGFSVVTGGLVCGETEAGRKSGEPPRRPSL